jgi:DNA-binding NarL/FixJ family response regulator
MARILLVEDEVVVRSELKRLLQRSHHIVIVSMPLSFLVGILASLTAREPTAEAQFAAMNRRRELGSRA